VIAGAGVGGAVVVVAGGYDVSTAEKKMKEGANRKSTFLRGLVELGQIHNGAGNAQSFQIPWWSGLSVIVKWQL
jgi:hypothetical protein